MKSAPRKRIKSSGKGPPRSFSDCRGRDAAAEAVSLKLEQAASLKRCPDTNRWSSRVRVYPQPLYLSKFKPHHYREESPLARLSASW
jgi:hypothetical protein